MHHPNQEDRCELAPGQLRIALLGYRSHPAVGGQGIYISQLANALVALGHSVWVFSGPPYPMGLEAKVHFVEVPSLDLYASKNAFTALRLQHLTSCTDLREWLSMQSGGFGEPLSFSLRVAKLLSSARFADAFDIVHDNQCLGNGLAKLVAFYRRRKINTKVTATIHHPIHRDRTYDVASQKSTLLKLLKKRWYHFIVMQERVYPTLDQIITVSDSSKRDILTCFGEHPKEIEVVPCGVDTRIFFPSDACSTKPSAKTIQLICVSSSDLALKGLRYLISALAKLEKQSPGRYRLQLIGRLDPSGVCYQLAKESDILHLIDSSENLRAEDVAKAFRAADIAVVPSLYEGFGLPALEAMACGVPLITTDGGALPEVAGNAAIVVNSGSAQRLACAIDELSHDVKRQESLREKGLARVSEHYTWRAVSEKFVKVLTGHEADQGAISPRRSELDENNTQTLNEAAPKPDDADSCLVKAS